MNGSADGLIVVDKPQGWTSHDVVARCRRLAATRKVGHAGTLDPMATGVLVVGAGRATKLLGHLALTTKSYVATVRLGESTITDDAEGEVTTRVDAAHLAHDEVERAMETLRGEIQQRPSAVSAIKIKGERAYKRVRQGHDVELPERPVTVSRFVMDAWRTGEKVVDVDVVVECSTGTYVRALARDLGTALGVGGHLTMLRRTRVGPFTVDDARTLEQLAELDPPDVVALSLDAAVAHCFATLTVGDDVARGARNGRSVPAGRLAEPFGVLDADGHAVGIFENRGDVARPLLVFPPRA